MPAASMKPKNNTNGMSAVNNDSKNNPVKDDTSNKDEYLDPKSISQGIIDKKIRNLVKRRDKLMDFKNKEERGQKLEKEQKDALSKLDYVVETIEMLKDISKNVTESLNDFEKKKNKAQKKEAIAEKAKQKAEDSSRLHVMYQLPFIARFFDKIRPVLEQEGKLESNCIEAFSQFSALFNKYDNDTLAVLERFFAGDSSIYAENVSYAGLKDGLFGLFEANFFKSFLEPEIGYVSFEQEQVSLNGNVESETVPIVPPVVQDVRDCANIENDMQSKDPAVLAVGHGFTFQGLPPVHPINGVAFLSQMPVFPHPPIPNRVPTEEFQMMNPPVPMEPHVPPPTSEDEKNVPVTDESKSDGASTPEGQVGNFGTNRRGNFRGRGRSYYRGNRNNRPKIGYFNPKGSNDEMSESPEGPKEENREVKKRFNKPRSARIEENGHSQNDQAKPPRSDEQRPIQQAKNSVSPQGEQKVKPQTDGELSDNANSKKNFNGGEKRNNWVNKRPFNNNGHNHPAENGDSVNYDKPHDGQRPFYNNRGGYNRNGFRGGRGGFRNNNNNFGNRPYQQPPQGEQQQQRA